MAKGKILSEAKKDMIVEFYGEGKNENDIAKALDISYSSVLRTLQDRGLKEVNVRTPSISLDGVEERLDEVLEGIDYLTRNLKQETLTFIDLGFKKNDNTWCSTNMKVNLGSSRIVTFYLLRNKGTPNEKWEAMSVDPKVIEAVWTDMKQRGWDWYK